MFGGALRADVLPVFHFHDETAAALEPKFRYLAENGYRTVTSDQIAAYARGEWRSTERVVALCFDDAWASLWTTAAPLLKRYGLTAITYAIPARIADAAGVRPALDGADDLRPAPLPDGSMGPPFVTWPELRALSTSGAIDVQCHTESHSRIFVSDEIAAFVTPAYTSTPLLNRPQLAPPPSLRFVEAAELGAPLYPARSRMADGHRVAVSLDIHQRCVEFVTAHGGAAFFERPDWRRTLVGVAAQRGSAPIEREADRDRAIEEELDHGRAILNDRLRSTTVNHVCLPWGVSGAATRRALERLGYRSAFANRMRGTHAVRAGDDVYWLKRLPNKYIFRLPGDGRRWF